MAPALVSHLTRSPSVVVPFTVLEGMPASSDATYLVMAVDEKGEMRSQQSGRLPRAGVTPAAGAPRLSLPAGSYQFRLIVQGTDTNGTVFSDLRVPKAAASPAACAGIYLEQAGAEPASGTHVFAAGAAVRAHATVAAPDQFTDAAVSALLAREDAGVDVPLKVAPAGRGWWGIESSLTLPTVPGRYRLSIHSDGRALDGCSTQLDVVAK
jgi:hypothetical protein